MRAFAIALTALLMPASIQASPIDELTFYTESYPPFQYREDGELKGRMVEILRLMLAKANAETKISDVRLVPWARGFNLVKEQPNTVLFGTSRTASREEKFAWVGPVMPLRQVIIGPKVSAHDPNHIAYFKDYRIATIRDDVAEELLLVAGLKKFNLMRQPAVQPIIDVLEHGRAEFWAYNERVAFHILAENGLKQRYETVFLLETTTNWFAINPDSDPAAIEAMQDALDAVKATPAYQEILERDR